VTVPPPPVDIRVPSGGWPEHPLFRLENLYRAYRQCRRRKRNTHNALVFERALEDNLVALRDKLRRGTYRPGRFLAFMVDKPKRREIFAADFRDRVVHHLLVDHLERRWEPRFIHDSFACRRGKGTHEGVERLRSFTRKVTANGTRRAWYLQLDVRGFFVTLDRRILWDRFAAVEGDPAILWLLRMFLFHEPTANCRFRGARRIDFERLPAHKTLFRTSAGCGLPIGNLTSQFGANVYLDALDQFVKHALKVRYYVRYCDDMVLLSADRTELQCWETEIRQFLTHRLRLRLNDRRRLRPVSDGIDFLGYIVRPDYLLVRRRVVGALRERLRRAERELARRGMVLAAAGRGVFPWPRPLLEQLRQWLGSYLAHLDRASSRRLLEALRRHFAWLDEYFAWNRTSVEFRCPIPRRALRFAQQKSWFLERLPGHVLIVREGPFCERITDGVSVETRRGSGALAAVEAWPRRFPRRRLRSLARLLWNGNLPVAWIDETGRRPGNIAERALALRWAPAAALG
jgi:hypothetical protein